MECYSGMIIQLADYRAARSLLRVV